MTAPERRALISQIQGHPLIIGKGSSIAPYLELREKGTDIAPWGLVEINVQTGEAFFIVKDAAGQVKQDDNGPVLERVVLDLKNFYLAFKPVK